MSEEHSSASRIPLNLHALIIFLTAISLLYPTALLWVAVVVIPAVGMVSVVIGGLILAILVALVAIQRERHLGRLDVLLLLLGCVLLFTEARVQIVFHPGYGTDEGAFLQGAASLLLHGHDPYGPSLRSAFSTYHVTAPLTYTMTGGVVSGFGYPGLAVLIATAFLWLSHSVQAAVWADISALTVAMVLGFFMLPRQVRGLSVLLAVGLPFLFDFAAAGVDAVLMVPFLMVTAWRWTDIGKSGSLSRADWVRAACLGLALSIEQLSWFIAPFLIVGIWIILSRRGTSRQATITTVRFGIIAIAAFLLSNSPFIILGPGSWIAGILEPLTARTIVNGQGIIDAAIFFHIGGGDVAAFTVAAALSYVALLVAFGLWFGKLGRAVFILPVIPFFLSAESLSGYWTVPLLVWTVSLLTVDQVQFGTEGARRIGQTARWTADALWAALVVGTVGLLGLALGTPAPLQLTVTQVSAKGHPRNISHIVIRVSNLTVDRLHPHFTASISGEDTAFWRTTGGAIVVQAHSERTLVITPPRGTPVAATAPFVILAVTSEPETVSSTQQVVVPPRTTDSG